MSASHPSEACACGHFFGDHRDGMCAVCRGCTGYRVPKRALASRSPAPSDAIRHPDSFLVRIERPGGVRFMEATAPTLEEAAEGVGLHRRDVCTATFREATCDRARGHLGDHCATTDADGTLTWDDDCVRLSQASLPYKTASTIQGRLGVSSLRGPLVLDDSAAPSVEARDAELAEIESFNNLVRAGGGGYLSDIIAKQSEHIALLLARLHSHQS